MLQLRSEVVSRADRESLKEQLRTLETSIQDHLDLIKKQQAEARARKQELEEESEEEDEEFDDAERTLAIKSVEERASVLEADQVSCGVVFLQARSRRSGQEIGRVETTDNSEAFVGMPESAIGKIKQQLIGVVITQGHSIARVGIMSREFA
jgi:hypothetical protein